MPSATATKTTKKKPGPKTAAGKAKALANLTPHQFQPGESGNPAGRPKNAGQSIIEAINDLQGHTREQVKAVLDDPQQTVARVAAARVWWHATSQEVTTGGQPIAGADADRILDRLTGKPRQAIEHTGENGGGLIVNFKTGINLTELSDEDLATLEAIAEKYDLDIGGHRGVEGVDYDRLQRDLASMALGMPDKLYVNTPLDEI